MTDVQRSDLVNMLCPTFTTTTNLAPIEDSDRGTHHHRIYKNMFPSFFLSGKRWQIDYQPVKWTTNNAWRADLCGSSRPTASTSSSETTSCKSSTTSDSSTSE